MTLSLPSLKKKSAKNIYKQNINIQTHSTMYVTLKWKLEVTVSVYSSMEETHTRHREYHRRKNVFRGLSFEKAVFHRKKVVQLSRNNHCHAILKKHSLDYDSYDLVFPPFSYASIKLMSENQLWVAGGKIQNVDAPFFPSRLFLHHRRRLFHFLLSFSIMEISNYSDSDFNQHVSLLVCS